MAIRPPSDIVLDVARAADPMRYEQAKTRLHEMAGSSGASFDDVFDEVIRRPGSRRTVPFSEATAMMHFRNTAALNPPRTNAQACAAPADPRKAAAYEAFEAMALRNVVETMLPRESTAVFGKGFAGSVWKSLLAEQVAAQMAHAGGIGIAQKLLAADPSAGKAELPRSVDDLAADLARAGDAPRAASARAVVTPQADAVAAEIETLLPAATTPPVETLPPLAGSDDDTLL